MTDTAEFLAQALRDIEFVKSEASLMGWHDLYFTSLEYLHMTKVEAKRLDDAFHSKLAQFMPAGLAG